jgi:hypothetical protein
VFAGLQRGATPLKLVRSPRALLPAETPKNGSFTTRGASRPARSARWDTNDVRVVLFQFHYWR